MNDLLCAAEVQRRLTFPYRVTVVETSPSTNTAVKELAKAGEKAGYVLIADRQIQGRGRLGRSFHSPEGTGLYLSVLLRPDGTPSQAVWITTVAAVAAARAVQSALGLEVGIKWVNDLYYNGRKVCGILTESAVDFATGSLDYVVCGIGFNVFWPSGGFPEELKSIAGALCDQYEESARCRLAAAFLNEFSRTLQEDRSTVLDEYRRRSILIGKTVFSPTGAFAGNATVLGIDDSAGLTVRLSDGTVRVLSSGEVSVKLYE